MRHTITLLAISICATMTVRAQYRDADSGISISDTRIVRSQTGATLSFRVDTHRKSVGSSRSAAVIPVITDGTNKASFPAVLIQGKRARTMDSRYEWVSGRPAPYHAAALTLRPGQQGEYSASVEYRQWMEGARLTLEKVEWGCCRQGEVESSPLLSEVFPPQPKPEPQPALTDETVPPPTFTTGSRMARIFPFVVRESEFKESATLSDEERKNALVIYYRVNNSVIDPSFSNNRMTLANLETAINTIRESRDSRIRRIVVAGFASPDGSLRSNDKLAGGRAAAIRDYIVQKTGVEEGLITLYNGSEDWQGLRTLVETSDMDAKQAVLDIIDNVPAVSADGSRKEKLERLKALDGGGPYRFMLANMFPHLRNSAFIRVYYGDLKDQEKE